MKFHTCLGVVKQLQILFLNKFNLSCFSEAMIKKLVPEDKLFLFMNLENYLQLKCFKKPQSKKTQFARHLILEGNT